MKYRPHIEARWKDRWENEARLRHADYKIRMEFERRLKLAETVLAFSIGLNIVFAIAALVVNKYLHF